MAAELEWLEGRPFCVRCGPEFQKHGDRYTFAVSGEIHEDGTAKFKGGAGKFEPAMISDIEAAVVRAFPHVVKGIWEHKIGDRTIEKVVWVKKP